jgi:hypothetical protein
MIGTSTLSIEEKIALVQYLLNIQSGSITEQSLKRFANNDQSTYAKYYTELTELGKNNVYLDIADVRGDIHFVKNNNTLLCLTKLKLQHEIEYGQARYIKTQTRLLWITGIATGLTVIFLCWQSILLQLQYTREEKQVLQTNQANIHCESKEQNKNAFSSTVGKDSTPVSKSGTTHKR